MVFHMPIEEPKFEFHARDSMHHDMPNMANCMTQKDATARGWERDLQEFEIAIDKEIERAALKVFLFCISCFFNKKINDMSP